jgi:enterochelin esterase-like enzyme
VPSPRLNIEAVRRLMAGRDRAWWIRGDVLTLIARPREGWAMLCCSIQTPLEPIEDTDLAMISVRVPHLDEAIFDITVEPGFDDRSPPVYYGPKARKAPARVSRLTGRVAIHMIRSAALGTERRISVYVPPGLGGASDVPVIYAADEGAASFLDIAEQLITSGRIRPVIVVGISAARGGDPSCVPQCDARSLEYIPGWGAGINRFDAHNRFVMEEVIPFVEARYPVARNAAGRTTAGYSSGATWALSAAAQRPDVFGNVIGLSMGTQPGVEMAGKMKRGRLFLAAGLFEQHFHERSLQAAEAARLAGAEVRIETPAAGHSFTLWDIAWADALLWLYGGSVRSADPTR